MIGQGARVVVLDAQQAIRYDEPHKVVIDSMSKQGFAMVRFDPPLPALTNGETLKLEAFWSE
jgi:hypothetical protein